MTIQEAIETNAKKIRRRRWKNHLFCVNDKADDCDLLVDSKFGGPPRMLSRKDITANDWQPIVEPMEIEVCLGCLEKFKGEDMSQTPQGIDEYYCLRNNHIKATFRQILDE